MQRRIFKARASLVLSVCSAISAGGSTRAASTVNPPADAVIVGATPAVPPPASRLQYAEVVPGLLERSLFKTTDAWPVGVEFVDILVAPGQSVRVAATQFAGLLEIEAGAPQLSVDDKPSVFEPGRLLGIDQGHEITIDNRQQPRAAVARLIKLQAQGN